jgi:hypothetical protein
MAARQGKAAVAAALSTASLSLKIIKAGRYNNPVLICNGKGIC